MYVANLMHTYNVCTYVLYIHTYIHKYIYVYIIIYAHSHTNLWTTNSHENGIFVHHTGRLPKRQAVSSVQEIFLQEGEIFLFLCRGVKQSCSIWARVKDHHQTTHGVAHWCQKKAYPHSSRLPKYHPQLHHKFIVYTALLLPIVYTAPCTSSQMSFMHV